MIKVLRADLASDEAVMQRFHISGLPVTREGKLVGILTNRDVRFERNLDQLVRNVRGIASSTPAPVSVTPATPSA